MAKDVFQRKEIKYVVEEAQYRELRERLEPIAAVDAYGLTPILNIYWDTPDFRLIRQAMEHPMYREKLRLRSYGVPDDDSPAFIEIKKKYDGVVYKRRMEAPYQEALDYLVDGMIPTAFTEEESCAGAASAQERQIQREIDYLLCYYRTLRPAMGIAYDRIALAGREDPELRITFDTNLRWSADELDLRCGNHGRQILRPGQYVMEIKIDGAMDLRLSHMLSEMGIFHTSISKYGRGFAAYMEEQNAGQRTVCVPFCRPAAMRTA